MHAAVANALLEMQTEVSLLCALAQPATIPAHPVLSTPDWNSSGPVDIDTYAEPVVATTQAEDPASLDRWLFDVSAIALGCPVNLSICYHIGNEPGMKFRAQTTQYSTNDVDNVSANDRTNSTPPFSDYIAPRLECGYRHCIAKRASCNDRQLH